MAETTTTRDGDLIAAGKDLAAATAMLRAKYSLTDAELMASLARETARFAESLWSAGRLPKAA